MTTAWQVLTIVVEVVAWLASPPTSLADAARREALRRQFSAPSVAVSTNATLPFPWPSEIAPPEPSQDEHAQAGAPPVVLTVRRPAPGSDAPEAPPDNEAAWRQRAAALRTALDRDRAASAAAESQLALLKTQAIARDDPAQQALLRQEIGKTLAEIDALTRRVEAGQRALEALGDEARRLGIPPGWIR